MKARNSLFSPGFGALARLNKQREELNKGLGDNGKKESKFMSQIREKSNKSLVSNKENK